MRNISRETVDISSILRMMFDDDDDSGKDMLMIRKLEEPELSSFYVVL